MWPGPYGEWGSRKYLMNSLDQSLQRMNLDYVDIFYSHRFDPDTPLDETLQAMVDIVKQGKALYVGISKYPAEAAKYSYDYFKSRDIPCLLYQGKYNLLNREAESEGILEQAKDNGVGYIAFSPLAQGLLTDRYISSEVPENSRMARGEFLSKEQLTSDMLLKIRKLTDMAASRGQSLAEMALAWVLKDDLVTSVIVGVSKTEQLKNNLKAISNLKFSKNELEEIEGVLDVKDL
jgi:L-glyceraldehyde 3-phosphate reductase